MPVNIEQAADLREAYLFVFDAFAASVSEVADTHATWNTRYARELLGALQHGKHVVLTEDGEGSEAYQAQPTYDDITRVEAEARIDKWLGVQPPPDPRSATTTQGSPRSSLTSAAVGPHPCGCGCGEVLTTRAVYRPGHDARHAGAVGRAMATLMQGAPTAANKKQADALVATLPSEKLRAKAFRIRDNTMAKIKPNPARDALTRNVSGKVESGEAEPIVGVHADVDGIVKVGKNEYLASRRADGSVRYLKPGATEWQVASKTAAKTFQEG